ncbi:MAG: 2-hydroxychromene-2-carboxylate isomerase [Burkholderiales bacterium]|nr:2-hydroxychromene-2-carboxylate isomerase [Burkholderiales bacterium]
MKALVFHYDVVSPYAWLAFQALPQALQGLSHAVEYRPLLFAGLLKAHGHKGPAEIPGKREWTYRQVAWLARQHGVPLQLPQPHPFNPLALMRLGLACVPAGQMPGRRVVEALFRHAWCADGADPNQPERLRQLQDDLAPCRDPQGEEVKAELRALTDAALARGLFGVPTVEVDGRLYWGVDALPMLREDLLAEVASAPRT